LIIKDSSLPLTSVSMALNRNQEIHTKTSLDDSCNQELHTKSSLDNYSLTSSVQKKLTTLKTSLRGKVIEIEGNIGSGKTTLGNELMKFMNSESKTEDCLMFSEKVHDTFLNAFYGNPKRYAFAFQMYMLTTRLYQIDEGFRQARENKKLVLLDRGAVGDTLFALTSHSLKSMDDQDLNIYQSVCKERLPSTLSSKVDVVVYLDVDPAECHRRMNLRNRDSEGGVPLSYLEIVDSCYFHLFVDWLAERRGTFYDMNIGAPPPISVLRWSKFGKIEDVVGQLQRLADGECVSPTVKFQSLAPEKVFTINTQEEMVAAYSSLILSGTDTKTLEGTSSESSLSVVAINWSLTHNNEFKRVVMYYLSKSGNITFYGDKDHS